MKTPQGGGQELGTVTAYAMPEDHVTRIDMGNATHCRIRLHIGVCFLV